MAVDELLVPMVIHEAMDARTFPRLQESLQSFEGGLVDVEPIFLPSISKMRALRLYERTAARLTPAERTYTMYLKAFIENYRLGPVVSGYEWWLAWTILGGSSGILGGNQNNSTAKPGISNATFRSLPNNVILRAKDPVALQRTGRYPGELVPIEVQCSNWTFGGGTGLVWQGCAAKLDGVYRWWPPA